MKRNYPVFRKFPNVYAFGRVLGYISMFALGFFGMLALKAIFGF